MADTQTAVPITPTKERIYNTTYADCVKWYIRNRPEWGPFDTRGEAVAWAWSKTPPGMKRPKVDGTWDAQDSEHITTQVQITLQAFQQLGDAAESAARELRRMMGQIESVIPDTIEGKATETQLDSYTILLTAMRDPGTLRS